MELLALSFFIISIIVLIIKHAENVEQKRLKEKQEEASRKTYDKHFLESLKKMDLEIKEKNEIIDKLRMDLFEAKHNRITDDRYRDKYEMLQESYEKLQEDYIDLKSKYDETVNQLNDELDFAEKRRQSSLSLIRRHSDLCTDYEKLEAENSRLIHDAIRCIREETWGNILRLKAPEKYNLSPFRVSQIKFPYLDPEKVFYLPNRKTFHAVPWCYTLDKTPQQLKEMDIFTAIDNGFSPCSKCVNPDDYVMYSGKDNNDPKTKE